MSIKTFPVIVEDTYLISPQVKHFVLRCTQQPAFNYIAGQFITIHFEHEDKLLRRSYSIANAPAQNNLIEFAAGFVEHGPGTEFLFNLKPGDTVNISGPFGRLVLKDDAYKRYILVATSTGITPYRAMIEEIKQRIHVNPELNVVILLGVQTRNDILYSKEFLQFASLSPRITFKAHLSRETAVEHPEYECCGYVQKTFPELSLNPEEDIIYLCGNPAMIDDAFAYLKDVGFSTHNIIREKYISAK